MNDASPCVPDYCGQAMNDDSPTAASLLPLPGHRRRCAAASAAQCAAAAFTAATDAFAALPSTLPPPQPPPLLHTHRRPRPRPRPRPQGLSLFSGPRRLQHSPDMNFSPLPRDAALRRLNVRALSPVTLLSFQTPHMRIAVPTNAGALPHPSHGRPPFSLLCRTRAERGATWSTSMRARASRLSWL